LIRNNQIDFRKVKAPIK